MSIDTKKFQQEIIQRLYRIDNELFGIPCNATIKFSKTFEFYTNKDISNREFNSLFDALNKDKEKLYKQDTWGYANLMGLINPHHSKNTSMADLSWLINYCHVPEGHVFNRHLKYFDNGFDNMILSRYGGYLTAKTLSEKHINADDFMYEKLAFVRAYFAFQDTDLPDIISSTFDYIRGEKLKSQFEIAMARIGKIIQKFTGSVDWLDVNNFTHQYIFNILFGHATTTQKIIRFSDIYAQAIPRSRIKTPVPFISPHIMTFLIQNINNFCNEIWGHVKNDPSFILANNIENLAFDFFMNVRYGIENAKLADPKIKNLFLPNSIFTKYHHSDCLKCVKQIENGTGRKKQDKLWNIEYRENQGISHYAIYNHLFSDVDLAAIRTRKNLEQQLIRMYKQETENPIDKDIQTRIQKLKSEIEQENINTYGIHIPEFLDPLARNQPEKTTQLELFQDVNFVDIDKKVVKQNRTKIVAQPKFERIDFDKVNAHFSGYTLISFLEKFLPGGILRGKEYMRASLYPLDTKHGDSFRYNISTGKFADFAAGQSGMGVISLVMYSLNYKAYDAAKFLCDWSGKIHFNEPVNHTPRIVPLTPKKTSGYLVPPIGTPAPEAVWYDKQIRNIDQKWAYCDKNGIAIMYDCRLNLANGKKAVVPMKWGIYYGQPKWISGAISENRPLYNLQIIQDYNIVYISEGCKTADAISFYINDGASVTWCGGANGAKKTDWTPIKNKTVIIIPDADKKIAEQNMPLVGVIAGELLPWDLQPGQKVALEIAKILAPNNENIYIVNTQAMTDIKDGWDIADAQNDNWTAAQVKNFIQKNMNLFTQKAVFEMAHTL